jgi:hypothetical protein
MRLDRRGLAAGIAGFCTFANLYMTRPLLAVFAQDFGVPDRRAALTVTVRPTHPLPKSIIKMNQITTLTCTPIFESC